MLVDIADAVSEILALSDEESHKFGGVGAAHTEFGELLAFVETELFKFGYVIDFADCADGETTKVGVDDNRLRVSVADDANAHITQHLMDVFAEFGAEVRVLDVVDVEVHHTVVDGAKTSATSAEMGMVIGAIEKVSGTRIFGDYAEKSAHNLLCLKMIMNI